MLSKPIFKISIKKSSFALLIKFNSKRDLHSLIFEELDSLTEYSRRFIIRFTDGLEDKFKTSEEIIGILFSDK